MKQISLVPIFLIVLVDILGLTIVLPLLPFYAEQYGASATMVGFLFSSYAICQFLASPIVGRISDRIGRRPMLLLSQVGTLAGLILLALAHSYWLILLSRIIDGITAGNISLAQAYIADVSGPKERVKALGLIGIAFGVGFLVGPAFSGYLSQFGFAFPVLSAAMLSMASIICTAVILPQADPRERGEGEAVQRVSATDWRGYAQYFARPVLGSLLVQYFFFAFSFTFFFSGCALFAQRRFTWNGHPFGAKEVGYVFAYIGFLGIVFQGWLIGKLVKRFGERNLVWSAFGVTTASSIWLAWVDTVPQLLANATFGSYGTGIVRTALTARITHHSGRLEQGAVLGVSQSLMSMSQIVAPPLAGILIDRGMLITWNLVVAALAFCGMATALWTEPMNREYSSSIEHNKSGSEV